jgi:hypothetical protein
LVILLPILWLLLWGVISVLVCAFLGLSPDAALHIGGLIFLAGGFGLPCMLWLAWRRGRFLLLQNLHSRRPWRSRTLRRRR